MLISVIVPTYHRNDLLTQCLTRLAPQSQTLAPEEYEVIVTDDGRDSTAEALIREEFPWARWVQGPQRGPAANRNRAGKLASGQWLAFVDDDCLPSSQWLSAFVAALKTKADVYEGCTTCLSVFDPLTHESPVNLTGNCLWSCNFMISRLVFLGVGGFDETFPFPYQEDTDFRLRLIASGYAFPFVSDAIVDHPPRIRRFGAKMGQVRECDVQLWYKGGQSSSIALRLLYNILRQRSELVLSKSPPGRSTVTAIGSMLGELGYVLRHVRGWDAKYAARYKDVPPLYYYRQI